MALLSAFGKQRSLTFELTKREVLARYRGSNFGLLWALLSPFLMLLIYTLAFGFIMKGRWPGAGDSTVDFALILFAGLTVHGFFADCLIRAPSLIVGNANYVKRVVFPLDVLGWSMVLSALFQLAMNLIVLLLLQFIVQGQIHVTSLLLPVVIAPLVVLTVGVGWVVSALAVYLRDIGQLVGVLATALLFLSSAIIPLESIPDGYRTIFELNPLTLIINQVREVVIWGRLPDWSALALYSTIAASVAVLGNRLFNRLSSGFADAL